MQEITLGSELKLAVPAFVGWIISLFLSFGLVEWGNGTHYALIKALMPFPGMPAVNVIELLVVCAMYIPAFLGTMKTFNNA